MSHIDIIYALVLINRDTAVYYESFLLFNPKFYLEKSEAVLKQIDC
jgi:hypothetical protein